MTKFPPKIRMTEFKYVQVEQKFKSSGLEYIKIDYIEYRKENDNCNKYANAVCTENGFLIEYEDSHPVTVEGNF